MKFFFSAFVVVFISLASKSQSQWVGNNLFGNFTYTNNWFGDVYPAIWNSSTDLLFAFRNNVSQSSINYDNGYWENVKSIIYLSTFTAALPFNANGNGLNFWNKIQNFSSYTQTLNVPLSGKGSIIEFDPTDGALIINSIIYNDNNVNYEVYGPNGKKLSLNNILKGGVANNLAIKEYSKVSIGFANTGATGSFGNGVNIETGELWFEEGASINGGIIKVGNGNSNVARLYLNDVDGGSTINNNITVPSSSSQSYIGALNTSGINTYSGSISLSAPVQLESFNGGTVNFSGDISGNFAVIIDDVMTSAGNATVQYSGIAKSYTGTTHINSGATLRISSNQILKDIVLNSGGKLIIDNGVTLTVNGGWTGAGEIINNGTMVIVGTIAFPNSSSTVTSMNILNINRGGTVNMDKDITVTGSLILTSGTFDINAGKKLTLDGASLIRVAGFLDGTSTSDFTVTGSTGGTVAIPAGITLRNVTVDGNRVLQLNGINDLTLHGLLSINTSATFSNGGDVSQITNNPGASINITGTFITMHPGGFVGGGSAIPAVPVTLNSSSTIEYGRAGDQAVQGSTAPMYMNITLSGSGTKTLASTNAISTGTVTIKDAAIFNAQNKSFGDGNTNLVMSGTSVFRMSGAGVKPDIGKNYTIGVGTTMQYDDGAATNIRLTAPGSTTFIPHYNVIVNGTDISTGSATSGLLFQTNGSFIVKTGATFKVATNIGFAGDASNTAIRATNNPSIILESNSTIEYSTTNPQTITNTNPYQNLSIAGTFIKTAPSTTLTVQGNLTKSGASTFAHNDGLVLLNGTNQNFAGLDYYGLEMTSGNKTTNGDASIADVLQLNANTILMLQAGDSITLKSTAAKTARFGQLGAGASITYGNIATSKFVVERNLLIARKWRLLATPTNDAAQTIRKSWQENGVYTPGYGFKALDPRYTNTTTLGFDSLGNNSSVKKFNSAAASWDYVANTDVLPISAEKGYIIFVAGDRSVAFPGSNATTLRTAGQLYTGTQPLVNVNSGRFAIVGNAYASRLDLRNITKAGGVNEAFYIWDPSLTSYYGLGAWNTFSKYTNGDYYNLLSSAMYGISNPAINPQNFIESGLAFIVHAPLASGTIFLEESDKASGSSIFPTAFVSGNPQNLRVNLNLVPQNTAEPILLDGLMANFDAAFSNELEINDIFKMQTFGENISFKTAGSLLVIDRRFSVANTDTLHINMTNMRVQNYQWQVILDNMDYPGRTAFLIDSYLQSSTPLNMADTTNVNFNVVNIAGSYATDRFKIVFHQSDAGPVPVTIATVTASRKANRTIDVLWRVENEINITNYEVQRSADGNNFGSIQNKDAMANNGGRATYNHIDLIPLPADNFYRIKATSINGLVQYSAIVKVSTIKQSNNISIYPNPVADGYVQVLFNGQPAGKYKLQLSNIAGQLMYQGIITVTSDVQSQNILLPAGTASGSYQLRVIAADGTENVLQVMVK